MPRSSPRGAALLLVLGFLVLITVVVIAFFSSVSTELSTATSAAAEAASRELADASVQLVVGQIRQATSLGSNVAWASQPGMIRTYGSGTAGSYSASSEPLAYYKLYSSDNMVVDAAAESFLPLNDIPANWSSRPAIFSDLNAPVASATGKLSYPIMDPTAADVPEGKSDPLVEGFSITNAPTTGATSLAPMPVKWIYVLRDGTLSAPVEASSTATMADFSSLTGVKKPTADNPIVGRVAFWTDDETCKLNLNTACGGTYWDSPMFTTVMEQDFSRYKPMAGEYYRYPGHPATTSLIPVFWSLTGMTTPHDNLFPAINPSISDNNYNIAGKITATLDGGTEAIWANLLQLAPRNMWGGSKMGSVATNGDGASTTALGTDADRLYASVDEALFGYNERGSKTPAVDAFSMTNDSLSKRRFFLTTSSRAPDTNPFNQPRVSIWPIPEDLDHRSAIDSLIAFCSTLKPSSPTSSAYFFTRKNSESPIGDWTSRNDQIFDYLDTDFQRAVPGFGRSISDRTGVIGERRTIALIYDYIRSTINLEDTHFGTSPDPRSAYSWNLCYNKTFAPSNALLPGYGQVTPITITKGGVKYKGIGRFPVINQAAIVFVAQASNQMPLECASDGKPLVYLGANLISGADGSLSNTALEAVLSGQSTAMMNPNHLWLSGTGTGSVPQFQIGGNPVLAVDPEKKASNPTEPEKWLFPIFGTAVADAVSSSGVSVISNMYPTLYARTVTDGVYGIKGGATQTITTSSGTHTYVVAALPDATGITNPAQTHAGLPFLTVQSPVTGAFSLPNARYQGLSAAYPDADAANIRNSRLLPDLAQKATLMQAVILLDPVDLAAGKVPLSPRYQVRISGLQDFKANGVSLGFSNEAIQSCSPRQPSPFYYLGMDTISVGLGVEKSGGPARNTEGSGSNKLAWAGNSVTVGDSTFAFSGGDLKIEIFAADPTTGSDIPTTPGTLVQTYTINFPSATFPTPVLPHMPATYAGAQFGNELLVDNSTGGWKVSQYRMPDYDPSNPDPDKNPNSWPARVADLIPSNLLTFDVGSRLATNLDGKGGPNYGVGPLKVSFKTTTADALYVDGVVSIGLLDNNRRCRFFYNTGNSNEGCRTAYLLPERNGSPATDDRVKRTCDTIRSVECKYGDPRVYASKAVVGPEFFTPHKFYYDATMRAAHTLRGAIPNNYPGGFTGAYSLFRGATEHFLSDACLSNVNWDYNPLRSPPDRYSGYYRVPGPLNSLNRLAGYNSSLGMSYGIASISPSVTSSTDFTDTAFQALWRNGGDFSNGLGSEPDGPYIGKPNESGGNVTSSVGTSYNNFYPEWWTYDWISQSKSLTLPDQFSANRMIASPVAFGSLPTGDTAADAWKTLLFCPNPNASSPAAYTTRMSLTDVTLAGAIPTGAKAPDHLFLDFFTMPVVEPYAISEPFATAGRVNMNYQIVPFTYIQRNTALRGVFAGTLLTAVEDKWVGSSSPNINNGDSHYKSNRGVQGYTGPYFATTSDNDKFGKFLRDSGQWGFRYPIHAGETLKQFQQRFDNGDIFRSPSEICSIFLYPAKQPTPNNSTNSATALVSWDAANANILDWWYADPAGARKSLTGDNMRERPYDSLYPRLTTKSNSYTVHFRVQVLKKTRGTDDARWVEDKDRVISEYRGSSLIERYIDPSDPSLPDFAADPTASLDNYYKYRVVSTKKFTAE